MTDFETFEVGYVASLKQRIFELEQGSCRFNCRTEKEAFIAGFKAGYGCEPGHPMDLRAYKEWKSEQT